MEEESRRSDELIDEVDLKRIFKDMLPIYRAHKALYVQLDNISRTWSAETCIGEVIVSQVNQCKQCILRKYFLTKVIV